MGLLLDLGLIGPWNLGREGGPRVVQVVEVDDGWVPAATLVTQGESIGRFPDVHDLLFHGLFHADRWRRRSTGVFQHHRNLVHVLKGEGNADGIDQLTVGVENAHRSRIIEAGAILVGGTTISVNDQPDAVGAIAQILVTDLSAHDVGGFC